jgi:hypothetical protein
LVKEEPGYEHVPERGQCLDGSGPRSCRERIETAYDCRDQGGDLAAPEKTAAVLSGTAENDRPQPVFAARQTGEVETS